MQANELFTQPNTILLDGGMGTMLQAAGLKLGARPEELNITDPQLIESIHSRYAAAGSRIINANTFGASAHKLAGSEYTLEEIIAAGIANCKRACAPYGALAALDVGPLGELLEPNGTLAFEDAVAEYGRIVRAGVAAGADLVFFETFTDLYELKAALLAAKENCDLPILASMSFEAGGRTFTGCTVESFAVTARGLGANAVGINCSLGPKEIFPMAKRLAEAQRRTLQDEYFAHAEKAMDTLRAAKENAAALKTESAAEQQGVRFQLQEGEETLEKQLNQNLDKLEQMKAVSAISGTEIEYGANNKENAENIVRFFESIGSKVERAGFGTVELTRKGAKATVQHGNGPAKQIAAAAIPEVIKYGEQIGFVKNWKGRGYNTYTFVAPVMVGETKIYEAVIVNEYTVPNAASKFYVHEVCGSDGSLLTIENGKITKKKTALPRYSRPSRAVKPLSCFPSPV